MTKLSDERLAHYIEYADLVGDNGTPAISTGELASMARELQTLRASIPGGVGVKVKKLEWQERVTGVHRAETIVGDYRVWTHHEANGWAFWQLSDGGIKAAGQGTEAECFAAAQADYERRILSALDLSPAEGKSDRDMRDGMDCNYPDCGCCFDSKCSDAPDAAPSNPVISDEMLFTTIQDAYLRGIDWGRKYSSTEAEELKASYNYADKTTAALSVKPR